MTEERTRRSRRATRPGTPGSDPTPQRFPRDAPVRAKEDTDDAWGGRPAGDSNDERLKRDVPPHW